MKKLYYLCCIWVITGCSKNNNDNLLPSGKTIVTYNYSANATTDYNLFYNDSLGDRQYAALNGTSWSKSFTVKYTNGYVAGFGLTCTYPFIATTGDLKITINGQVKADSVYKFDSKGVLHFGTVTYKLAN
jgi:hypothetical protein